MMSPKRAVIYYKKRRRYKYTLSDDYVHETDLRPDADVVIDSIISLSPSGTLTIRKGYAWDGPSGPTIDTPSFMRGSLVHDALYQLMREQRIPNTNRKYADELLRCPCLEDGMWRLFAWCVYYAVRLFAASSAAPDLREAP